MTSENRVYPSSVPRENNSHDTHDNDFEITIIHMFKEIKGLRVNTGN